MANNYISFEDISLRSKYAREISGLLEQNNLRWWASPSVKKPEIFIRPKDSPEENMRSISRISLQIKEDAISFGISGYYPWQIKDIRNILESRGYIYHDKGLTEDGRPKGRWWLTKPFYNTESIVWEFNDIEPILLNKD
jgi:hypothetical protein